MKKQRLLKKYLQRNSYNIHQLAPIDSGEEKKGQFAQCIVIVACCEFDYLVKLFASLNNVNGIKDCAVVIVINNPQNADKNIINNNLQTLSALQCHNSILTQENIVLGENLFYIDAVNHILTEHNKNFFGVGAARKLGMDLSLQLLHCENNLAKQLFICLDADCIVDENYLSEIISSFAVHKNAVGGVCNFKHQQSDNNLQNLAIAEYEKFMHNYVNGLQFAQSPYSFHALGSAMVCTADAYIAVNGMVIREAGEDFYFLQKLCKYGQLITIPTTVYPASRISERVPFGTGVKIAQIIANAQQNNLKNSVSLPHYNNNVFIELKKIYEIIEKSKKDQQLFNLAAEFENNNSEYIRVFFAQQQFSHVWAKIIKNVANNCHAREKAFHVWFDGFKILKFIHFLEQYQFFFRI